MYICVLGEANKNIVVRKKSSVLVVLCAILFLDNRIILSAHARGWSLGAHASHRSSTKVKY